MEEICIYPICLKGQTWEYCCKDSHWDSWVRERHVSVVNLGLPGGTCNLRCSPVNPPPLGRYIRQDLATGYYLHDPHSKNTMKIKVKPFSDIFENTFSFFQK